MKAVLHIFAEDMKAILRNPIALIVAIALLVLPGLYAWYCILANWNPYGNTGNVPIIVVNKDKGTTSDLTGDLDIGEQVVEKLSDNHNIKWEFLDDEEEARDRTERGDAYAYIVLPEDLSQNIAGIFDGSGEQPLVYYYPNQRFNAVATKVTDSAAQTLIQSLNQAFASTVNEKVLAAAEQGADKVEESTEKARSTLRTEVAGVKTNIADVIASLDDAASSITNWRMSVAGAQEMLAGTANQLPTIRDALSKGSADLEALQAQASQFESQLASALTNINMKISKLSTDATALVNSATSDISTIIGEVNSIIAQLKGLADATIPKLIALAQELGQTDLVTKLTALQAKLDEVLGSLETINQHLQSAVDDANAKLNGLNAKVQEATAGLNEALNTFTSQVMPKLSSATQSLAMSLSGLSAAIGQFEPQIAELQAVLASTDDALVRALDATTQAKSLLSSVLKNLTNTLADLDSLRSALQLQGIADLLGMDPDSVGSFLSMPVNIEEHVVYPVSNYGSGVAPFYTNLALWVGCFILITVFRLEVGRKRARGATTTQRYLGRWLTLAVFAIIQSQVICGVDIAIGIDCANPVAFMVSGAICSFAYFNLIFALAITLRNIGKTLIILLLIMQVPGSSGMYPIEIMPGFFQGIHPLLPFTYGIDAMREALCGMYGMTYFADLGIVLIVVPIALLIGLVLRPSTMNLTKMFDTELAKTGFFAGEESGEKARKGRFRRLMRLFASSDSYRDDFEERAWRFNRNYPKLRRLGAAAFFAIPLAFLVLMLPINLVASLPTDVKLTVMVVMVILLLIAQIGMVLLEFAHHSIEEETRLMGAEMMADVLDDDMLMAMLATPDKAPSADGADDGEAAASVGTDNGASAGYKPLSIGGVKSRFKNSPIGTIFHTDLNLGFQSIIGAVVIVLLVITPSLYAWFNIAGSWDPYSATGGLRIAIANEDEGYKGDLMPISINVGDSVVSQLRANDKFDWQFVTADEAMTGIESGDYYASIVIPADFSRSMLTYLTGKSEHPSVIYYTNEKENPIAPLITQKGANALQENIRSTFTERLDEVGISLASDLVDFVNNPTIQAYVEKLDGHLDDAILDMQAGGQELRLIGSLSSMVSGIVTTAGSTFEGISSAVDAGVASLANIRTGAQEAEAAFNEIAGLLNNAFAESEGSLDALAADIDAALVALEGAAQEAPQTLRAIAAKVSEQITQAEEIRALVVSFRDSLDPGNPAEALLIAKANETIAQLDATINSLTTIYDKLIEAADKSEASVGTIEEMRARVQQLLTEAKQGIADAKAFYDTNVVGAFDSLRQSLATASGAIDSVFDGLRNALSGLSGSTGGLSGQLDILANQLNATGDKLESSANALSTAKKSLASALASGDVSKITELLVDTDAAELASRLASPIEEKMEALYPVENFGSALASFYTVLSLWVGALVMVSTMKARLTPARTAELRKRFNLKQRHEFLGRFGIFSVVGFAQSLIVCLGDLCLLHIQCVHPVLFVLMGAFIGQVFVLIVYTLTELFGDIGKAACVILLIMQVAASGGTFPIPMLDPFFQAIAPYLPFYHGMTAMQGCVAGMYNFDSFAHLAFLLIYVGGTLLIGVVARKPFRAFTDWLEGQMEKTGFM